MPDRPVPLLREGRTDQSIGNPAGHQSDQGSRPSLSHTSM